MALLPDPEPRQRQHVLISVDDHVIEPPDMFVGRLPSALADRAPKVVESDDRELGLAVLRAWNDWHLEVWAGSYPERIIPLQLPWLADPQLAVEEIRRNAARGFKAVSFPELPAQCGLPSLHTGVWDPFFAACQETDTVVCLHTGSAQWAPIPSFDTPFETITTLFPVNCLVACSDR